LLILSLLFQLSSILKSIIILFRLLIDYARIEDPALSFGYSLGSLIGLSLILIVAILLWRQGSQWINTVKHQQ
jgi:hypothetical protein